MLMEKFQKHMGNTLVFFLNWDTNAECYLQAINMIPLRLKFVKDSQTQFNKYLYHLQRHVCCKVVKSFTNMMK